MKTEKFKVIDYIRIFIKSISVNLDSFPKKEYELKERIKMNAYDVLELGYEANCTELIELKINIINKMLAKIKLVDYLLDLAVDMNLLNNKKYLKLSCRLGDIEKYTRGWMEKVKEDNSIYKAKFTRTCESNKGIKRLRSYKEPEYAILNEEAKKNIEQVSFFTN